jgi:hypothetical protein
VEKMDHILLGCFFSRELCDSWVRKLHLQDYIVVRQGKAFEWWIRSRKMIPKTARCGFDSLFFLIGWLLWKERNARTFNGVASSVAQLGTLIQEELDAWCMAGYKHLSSLVALP